MNNTNQIVCVDLFTDRLYPWMEEYHCKKASSRNGSYYTIEVEPEQQTAILKKARRYGIRYRIYDKCWSRASNYRDEFFKYNSPPYYCRYCGKELSIRQVVVDHVVPVAQTKKSWFARYLLMGRDIWNVNDIRNLVPCCWECNHLKGDKLGLWYIRGRLGSYRWFIPVYRIIKLLASICFVLFGIFFLLQFFSILFF